MSEFQAVPGLLLAEQEASHPYRTILRIRSITWLMVAGIGLQIPTYGVATFIVPLLQRYFGLPIGTASIGAGANLGLAGIIGLLLGGRLADRARTAARVGQRERLHRPLRARLDRHPVPLCRSLPRDRRRHAARPAGDGDRDLLRVLQPRRRDDRPDPRRVLSDTLATPVGTLAADAVGLHRALLVIVPIGLAIAVLGAWRASRALPRDREAMAVTEEMAT